MNRLSSSVNLSSVVGHCNSHLALLMSQMYPSASSNLESELMTASTSSSDQERKTPLQFLLESLKQTYNSTIQTKQGSEIISEDHLLPGSFPEITKQSIFERQHIKPPVVLALLRHPVMQRLKGIDQSGLTKYTCNVKSYSRYEHCLGVYSILRRYHASDLECIAGLLHDASHTVFSHVGDLVFNKKLTDAHSYQDQIHCWYLTELGIAQTLQEFNISINDILPENPNFTALEQDLPDICADRLEYNLHTALINGYTSTDEIEIILDNLQYQNGKWFFTDKEIASKFAQLPLINCLNIWGSIENLIVYHCGAAALKRAIEIGTLTTNDIHFSLDTAVFEKLKSSQDGVIQSLLEKCFNPSKFYQLCEASHQGLHLKGKFRGIDPLVRIDGNLTRLTALDQKFLNDWNAAKNQLTTGFNVKMV